MCAWVLGAASSLEGWGEGLQEILAEWCALNKSNRISLGEVLLGTPALTLAGRKLSPKAAAGIAAVVYLSPTLTMLDVHDNHQLGDAGVAAIATALAANPRSKLNDLHLANTGAGLRAAKALELMFGANTTLARVHLGRNAGLDQEERRTMEELAGHVQLLF